MAKLGSIGEHMAETLIMGEGNLGGTLEELATLRSHYHRKDSPVGENAHTGGPCGRSFWLQDQCAVLEELSVVTPRNWDRKESQRWPDSILALTVLPPTNPARRSVTEKGGPTDK